jgi:hypothetical protein
MARRDAPLDEVAPAPTGERMAAEPQFPHRMCNTATAYAASISTDVAAYDDLPGYHLLVAGNLITTNDELYHGSASELPPRPRTGMWNGISPMCQIQ